MLALMSLLTDSTMAVELSTNNQSQFNASSQAEGLCLAKVDIYENDCRAYNAESACPSLHCFWRQGYEEGKCWGKAIGDEACVNYNAKSDCDAQESCFWGQGYGKGKCLTHTKGYESMCLKYYTKSGCPAGSCYWGQQDEAELCLAKRPTSENYCRAYKASNECPSLYCFKGAGYERGKCWGKASGYEEDCRVYNAKSDCDAQGNCLWGQGYEKGKCLTHTHGYESMCLKYYTKSGCPDGSCYWGSVGTNTSSHIKSQAVKTTDLPDCSKTACPAKCQCGTQKCASQITDCLADTSCAAGETCANACPCGSLACLAGCAAKHPTAKGFAVLSCVQTACPGSDSEPLSELLV